ncbi:DUF4845 domain-containing protein [Marinobacter sp. X15-166B]|uniref:DUF4845 domain-containing protein n=1 Tax=Marinobacter sp. X15-166B TaxID=1897620 RepID=UPI00085C592C|nr:DUF4845 domain-containing protein [Marinobacter sp. X15-166B]OEY66906.1 DUF4845 domain-containing protein [Marinobacter sp. X15-166B]
MTKNTLPAMARQRGASGLTMLVFVLFFGSLLALLIKLGPIYMDDLTIQEIFEGLDGTQGLAAMGPAEVRSVINKRLGVNNVRQLDANAITIDKDGQVVRIKVDYATSTNLFRNVDAVVSFNHEYEITGK